MLREVNVFLVLLEQDEINLLKIRRNGTTFCKHNDTSRGFAIIEAEMRSVLSQGVANGLIADTPAYTVTVPDPLAIPEVDRALRKAYTFGFTARLASAVHLVTVRGVVTY